MRKELLLLAELAVSLAIIAAVLYFVEIGKVVEVLSRADLSYAALALAVYATINACMSYRIKIILAEMGYRIPLSRAMTANLAGMLVSDFTPARSGYFATAFALTANEKIPLDCSVVSILGPQMFDFMVKVGAGTVAIIFIIHSLDLGIAGIGGMLLGVVALASMLAFGVLLLFSKRFLAFLKIVERLPLCGKAYPAIVRMQENAVAVKKVMWTIAALLALTWGLKGLEWYLLALSIGMRPDIGFHPFLFFLFLQPLITMLQFIPTPTLAGMGLSEAGAVAVLALYGVSAPVAAAYAILTRSLMIVVDLAGVNEARKVVHDNLDAIFAGDFSGVDAD
ncbi:MAG: lysylphosphatidylglycerol synthase transmembrane domain-containing protein [Candidatus ainarchaeum sp.]|nr:lysylphosphatidylglycerol synthase transmembrane domain-containing protein [Candidatus ainarchaeum sp.]